MLVIIIIISIAAQAAAAFLALRLIGVTGRWTAWSLIAGALVLMVVRRAISLHNILLTPETASQGIFNEATGLALSLLMLAGIALISPLFMSIKRQERELAEAKARAEEASAAKSGFLANMSHELRTPLNAIIGFSDLMSASGLNQEQKEYNETVKNSAFHLLNLIDDALDISRIEASKLRLESEVFDLRATFESSMAVISRQAALKNLMTEILLDGALPERVSGDQLRFRQILINLLTNALKYTPAGSVTLKASLAGITGEKKTLVEVSVIDTGIGIPAEKASEIFEAFNRVEDSFVKRQNGSGLGLAIVKKLATAMGGTVEVASEPGKGSVFTVKIPFETADDIKRGPRNGWRETSSGEAARPPAEELVILVAEDDDISLNLLQKTFSKLGWRTSCAKNGVEAVELFKSGNFDAVLMDVQMPGMDGLTAAKEIRSLEGARGRRTPIIAFTAFAYSSDRDKCLAAEMDDHISKPVDLKVLVEKIRGLVLKYGRASSESPRA